MMPDTVSGTHVSITADGNPTPQNFWGSEAGTTVTLRPGGYNVAASIFTPDGLQYVSTTRSQCSGGILSGEVRTCTLTNTFRPTPSG